jgi:hypothetical protein
MYFLDFIDNSGVRIDERTNLDVFGGGPEGRQDL